jgi:uncharacterized protein (TIGR02145 family)
LAIHLGSPANPAGGTHVAGPKQIEWNWNTVAGATGYRWNTTNDYATALNIGAGTTYTQTGLDCNTATTRFFWAYSPCGTSTLTTLTKTTLTCAFNCGQQFLDTRDGKLYNTKMIGSQCWMKQNLNIGIRVNNSSPEQTNNLIIEKYCFYNNEGYCNTYGGLYQWNEMMNYSNSSNSNPSDRQGICPAGWHVPSDAEWCLMETYLDPTVNCLPQQGIVGTDVGGKMKETGYSHWSLPNLGATNSSGFTALPGGGSLINNFQAINVVAGFYSSTEGAPNSAWFHNLSQNYTQLYRNNWFKEYGWSCRCVKD